MKRSIYIAVLFLYLVFSFSLTPAQKIIKKAGGESKEIFFINELAIALTDIDNSIKVEHALPVDSRLEEYRAMEIKKDDEVLMLNKQRVKTVAEFTQIYEQLSVGEVVKLGLRRGEEMFIAEFKKMDPAKAPQRRMKIVKTDGPVSDIETKEGGVITRKLVINEQEGKIKPLLGAGLIMNEKNGAVFIYKNLQVLDQTRDTKEGAQVISLNGEKITSLDQFHEKYETLQIGEEVKLTTSLDGKETVIKFDKPDEKKQILIEKQK